jgi:hypothetical protein
MNMAMKDEGISEYMLSEIGSLRRVIREADLCFSMLRAAYDSDADDLRDKVSMVLDRWKGR